MAIAITGLYNTGTPVALSGTGFTAGASFTPVNSCLAIAQINISSFKNNAGVFLGDADNVALSGGGYTWVKRVVKTTNDGTYCSAIYIFTAAVTTGVSTTLVFSGLPTSAGDAFNRYDVNVCYATGYNTSTPTGATATGTSTVAGAMSITLSGSPASTSAVVAGLCAQPNNNGGTTTAGTGWTALFNDHNSFIGEQSQYIINLGSTTVPWQAQLSGDTVDNACQAAIEILAAGAVETVTMDKWWPSPYYVPPKTQMVGY